MRKEGYNLANKRTLNIILNNCWPIVFLFFWAFWMMSLLNKGQIIALGDFSFHVNRIEELYENYRQGNFFIFISSHAFKSAGAGEFLFYPYITLTRFAVFRFFFSPLKSLILEISFYYFLTLLISYFSGFLFTKNRLQSLLFSVIYCSIPYHFYLVKFFVLGEYISYTFLPLVFLGFYEIFYGNFYRWYLLSIGFSFLLYTHVLSVLLSFCTLNFFLFSLIFLRKIKFTKQRITALLKSILLTFCLSGFIFVPYMTDRKGIFMAGSYVALIQKLSDLIINSLNNEISPSIGFVLIIMLFFGGFFIKKLRSSVYFFLYIISIIIFWMTSSLFPWEYLAKINLKFTFFQFPYRFMSYAGMFLSIFAAKIIIYFVKDKKYIFCLFFVIFTLQHQLVYSLGNFWQETDINFLNKKDNNNIETAPESYLVTNDTFYYQFNYKVLNGSVDYFPEKSLAHADSILSHQAIFEKTRKQVVVPKSAPNVLKYQVYSEEKQVVDLPVLRYARTCCLVNGQVVKMNPSKRGCVACVLPKGKSEIKVTYRPLILYYLFLALSAGTWMFLIIRWIIKVL